MLALNLLELSTGVRSVHTIGVNLGFWTAFQHGRYKHATLTGLDSLVERFSINIMKKSAETPKQKPQANKPYRTEEVFEVFKVSV